MCVSSLGPLLRGFAAFALLLQGVAAGDPSYSPLRPPAIPLAVRNPYTNVWADNTAGGAVLNSQSPSFWNGKPVGWEGLVVVDDIAYEYLGSASQQLPKSNRYTSAVPLAVSFDSQVSNFTFQAGPVTIEASFLSPVTPKDICRSSIPLSYLTTTVRSNDGKPHHIRFYSDVSSAWLGLNQQADVNWGLTKNSAPVNATTGGAPDALGNIFTWLLSPREQIIFGEANDFPQWGNFTYTTASSSAALLSYEGGQATAVRWAYLQNRNLSNDASSFRTDFGDSTPVFAFSHDVGFVMTASVRYTVGTAQDPVIQYTTKGGLKQLAPWWTQCYGDLHSTILFHWKDYDTARMIGDAFESQLRTDINSFYGGTEIPASNNTAQTPYSTPTNKTARHDHKYIFKNTTNNGPSDSFNLPASEAQSYYAIVALSARQIMGAYAFAYDPRAPTQDPLLFQKEISSNGNVNTVDVLYPASPFFLYANPNLLRYALQPLYEYQEAGFYPNGYCIHDLGSHFPNATGHVEGNDEYMPVEESANFILMSYAYYKFMGDVRWLMSHYDLLEQHTQYLIEYSLVPATQLSTDDFAGTLSNQTNLAIKGIVGLQAMSYIAAIANKVTDATYYGTKAKEFYNKWEIMAIDPTHSHTTLAYGWRSSWGLLYNTYFDKLLNMGLISSDVYTMQSQWYPTVSQTYGVPLDNRHPYTKSDWELWTAATCHASTRNFFVSSLARWLNETVTDGPFTDLYNSMAPGGYPEGVTFRARPVAGGHFALLALGTTGQKAGAQGGDTSGSKFARNSWASLPAGSVSFIPPAQEGSLTDDQKDMGRVNVVTVLSGE